MQKVGAEGIATHQFIEVGGAELRMKANAVTVVIGGKVPEPPPSPTIKWAAAAELSEPVRRVFGYLAKAKVSWADLYKVIEVVQENGGGHLIGSVVSKSDINRITQTANSRKAIGDDARHGHDKFEGPRKTFPLPEAIDIVHRLVRAWIDTKR